MSLSMIQFILFVGTALTLVVPKGPHMMPILLLAVSLIYIIFRKNTFKALIQDYRSHPICIGFGLYALMNGLMFAYHHSFLTDLDALLPFLISPIFLVIFYSNKPKSDYFFWGCSVGALGAFVLALIQVKYVGLYRAEGFTNPIRYGDVSVILAAASLCGLIGEPIAKRKLSSVLYILGFVSGIFASLLSGSKGGWFSAATLLLILLLNVTSQISLRLRAAIFFLMVGVISGFIYYFSYDLVILRIYDAWISGVRWFETGQVVDGSVSLRLEMWRAAIYAILESPWVGYGNNFKEVLYRIYDSGVIDPGVNRLTWIDNNLLSVWLEQGILGFLSVFVVFISTFITFFKYRHSNNQNIKRLSMLGMILPILYFEFGLSVSLFPLSIFRQVYCAWAIVILGLILAEQSRNRESAA